MIGSIITISDTRDVQSDKSGLLLRNLIQGQGHEVGNQEIVQDDVYLIRLAVCRSVADPKIDFLITTGGTGITRRDVTPEAVVPLLDKHLEGFGELFRSLSFAEIGASAIQSRALGGVSNGTLIFCLPGSPGACRTAWEKILSQQLDVNSRPCNFAQLQSRL